MRIIASLLFFLLILLQAKLWFGGHGVFQLWSLERNTQQSVDRNQALVRRNDTLHAQVNELKQGSEALEERARSQLGFIKQGETFYRVVPKPIKAPER
ncbi:MAG: cell division protein FtsB [Arenicella sp.]|jgi:cell division protein FtsB